MLYKVFNPTFWDIEIFINDIRYFIPAQGGLIYVGDDDEPVEGLYDPFLVNTLLEIAKDMGLVSLEFGKKAQAKYGKAGFEKYKLEQILAGLKHLYKRYHELLNLQRIALQDKKQYEKIEFDSEQHPLIREFKNKLDIIEKLIRDCSKVKESAMDFIKLPQYQEITYKTPDYLAPKEKVIATK